MSWTQEQLNSALRANKELKVEETLKAQGPAGKALIEAVTGQEKPKGNRKINLLMIGQIRGGKNNMVVTRSGLHFPKKEWAKWRDEKVAEIKGQLPQDWEPISAPCNMNLFYVSGDKRRRDQPAIIDAIFHVLEKAGVVKDDTLIWVSKSTRDYDKENPLAEMEIYC